MQLSFPKIKSISHDTHEAANLLVDGDKEFKDVDGGLKTGGNVVHEAEVVEGPREPDDQGTPMEVLLQDAEDANTLWELKVVSSKIIN